MEERTAALSLKQSSAARRHACDDERIVEAQLGESSGQIDQDFRAWFGRRRTTVRGAGFAMQQQCCPLTPMINPRRNEQAVNNPR
jgi:hypothetical protein